MLQGDRQQVCSKWSPRRPRWVPEPTDPGRGFPRPLLKGGAAFPAPALSPGGPWAYEPGPVAAAALTGVLARTPSASSLRLGELPSGCLLLSVSWPGASEVIVARWGQGQT